MTGASAALAQLPDGRAYEMVTPLDKNAQEVGAGIAGTNATAGNAVNWEALGGCCGATSAASTLYQSTRTASGWVTTAKTPTPVNPLLTGLLEEQQPMWWSPDLSKTVYLTPSPYNPNDARTPGPGATVYFDLYEQDASNTLTWLSGPFPGAKDTNQFNATWAATTPDGNSTLFDSQDNLTSDATPLASLNTPAEYLFDTNVSSGGPITSLIDVTSTTLTADAAAGQNSLAVNGTNLFTAGQPVAIGTPGAPPSSFEQDTVSSVGPGNTLTLANNLAQTHAAVNTVVDQLISPDGAIAGNGNFLNEPSIPANDEGTTTNSISSDGTKVFFESPPTCVGGSCSSEGVGPPHLYMRDLAAGPTLGGLPTGATTALDDPSSSGQAVYEGASTCPPENVSCPTAGSLVFFSSNEGFDPTGGPNGTGGLGGSSPVNAGDNELYVFNTTNSAIGQVPAMSALPVSFGDQPGGTTDGNVEGITAISNDGSNVYFVAKSVLVSSTATCADGSTPAATSQMFYDFDTNSGATTCIATLGSGIPNDNRDKTILTGEPDTGRAAIPTPNGSALVFESVANLTAQNPSGPTTTLTADVNPPGKEESVYIPVASSAGFLVGRSVELESSFFSESATVMGIPDSTHLLVNDSGIGLIFSHSSGDSVVQRPPAEVYRYSGASNPALTCISCTPDTTLTAGASPGDSSITVASSAGFAPGAPIMIDATGSGTPESDSVASVPDGNHIDLTTPLVDTHASNAPVNMMPTGSAGLGASGGGSYGPQGAGVPMSSDGSRIFFDSPDPLTPGVISSPPIPIGLFGGLTFDSNVYEWENGTVSVISDGDSTTGSALGTTTPSGNDVFFTTEDQLVPQDTDGYDDIYDARVGGGFPAPPTPTPPCASADVCHPATTPTVFFPAPSSATLIEPTGVSPSFSVNSISAKQRRRFAATGLLTLTVHVTQAGKIAAVASDPGKRVRTVVASAVHSFFGTNGGTGKLTLRLSKAARKKLAKQHRLSIVIAVSYTESGEVYTASLTLTKAKSKASDRPSSNRRQTRER